MNRAGFVCEPHGFVSFLPHVLHAFCPCGSQVLMYIWPQVVLYMCIFFREKSVTSPSFPIDLISTCKCFLLSICAVTVIHSREHLWVFPFLCNKHFVVFEVKSTSSCFHILVKSTFCSFWSEINIFVVTSWCEINISVFVHWEKKTSLQSDPDFSTSKHQKILLEEIKFLALPYILKSKQQPVAKN